MSFNVPRFAALALLGVFSVAASAADVQPINDARVDLLVYALALIDLGLAVWAARKLILFFAYRGF